MSEIPEVFAIFEQKLAHVLSFTVVPLKSKDLKNALEEILTYFSGIVERASKAESRIAELEAEQRWRVVADGELPEHDGEYWVWLEAWNTLHKRGTCIYSKDYHYNNGFFNLIPVTHWMPLPEPPIVYGKVCEE